MVNVIAAVGLNLLVGNSGQVSLCHSSFMAVGAYSSSLLASGVGLPFWAAIPAGWAAAGLVDTDLSFLSFLELYRTDIAERRVTTRWVVEALDVVEHVGTRLAPRSVDLARGSLRLQ
jgi:branched-subunit amino acid ABC-type transport system permease component